MSHLQTSQPLGHSVHHEIAQIAVCINAIGSNNVSHTHTLTLYLWIIAKKCSTGKLTYNSHPQPKHLSSESSIRAPDCNGWWAQQRSPWLQHTRHSSGPGRASRTGWVLLAQSGLGSLGQQPASENLPQMLGIYGVPLTHLALLALNLVLSLSCPSNLQTSTVS